ncbi:MAG: hypothetical protein QM803_03245 [Rhodocyclaceae bacterium]
MRNSIQRLAHSANFEVSHEYETVWVTRQGEQLAVVGDFYGDPTVAIIDSDEKWCAIGGSGLIVYFLEEPFDEYKYDEQSDQYFEVNREGDNTWWVKSIHQTGSMEIQVLLETGATHNITFQQTAKSCAFVVR